MLRVLWCSGPRQADCDWTRPQFYESVRVAGCCAEWMVMVMMQLWVCGISEPCGGTDRDEAAQPVALGWHGRPSRLGPRIHRRETIRYHHNSSRAVLRASAHRERQERVPSARRVQGGIRPQRASLYTSLAILTRVTGCAAACSIPCSQPVPGHWIRHPARWLKTALLSLWVSCSVVQVLRGTVTGGTTGGIADAEGPGRRREKLRKLVWSTWLDLIGAGWACADDQKMPSMMPNANVSP